MLQVRKLCTVMKFNPVFLRLTGFIYTPIKQLLYQSKVKYHLAMFSACECRESRLRVALTFDIYFICSLYSVSTFTRRLRYYPGLTVEKTCYPYLLESTIVWYRFYVSVISIDNNCERKRTWVISRSFKWIFYYVYFLI